MVKPKKKTKTKLKDSPRGKQSHVKMTARNSPPPAQQTEQQKKPPVSGFVFFMMKAIFDIYKETKTVLGCAVPLLFAVKIV